jgi:hypothetical protein
LEWEDEPGAVRFILEFFVTALRAMELLKILNHCHHFRGFACQHARFSADNKGSSWLRRLRAFPDLLPYNLKTVRAYPHPVFVLPSHLLEQLHLPLPPVQTASLPGRFRPKQDSQFSPGDGGMAKKSRYPGM